MEDLYNVVTGRLENWYNDPDYNIIWGNLYDDVNKRWPDGQHIHTSSIVKRTSTHVKTLNSYYRLGQPRFKE